jgi:hypothetical protein
MVSCLECRMIRFPKYFPKDADFIPFKIILPNKIFTYDVYVFG